MFFRFRGCNKWFTFELNSVGYFFSLNYIILDCLILCICHRKEDFFRCGVSNLNWFVLIFKRIAYSSQLQEKVHLQQVCEVNVKYLKVKPRQWGRRNLGTLRRKAWWYHILMYNNYHSVWLLRAEWFLTFKYFFFFFGIIEIYLQLWYANLFYVFMMFNV